jgi:hypothetical protein
MRTKCFILPMLLEGVYRYYVAIPHGSSCKVFGAYQCVVVALVQRLLQYNYLSVFDMLTIAESPHLGRMSRSSDSISLPSVS